MSYQIWADAPDNWNTVEGRTEAIWRRIRDAGDTNTRRMELLRCRAAPVLPIITSEEFELLWERCQESGVDE